MEVIPSIDLKGGRCVRLYQGDFNRETVYSDDPLSVAHRWQAEGAPRLHLVDLDGAAQGDPSNREKISQIIKALSIPVQVGGGIRALSTAAALIDYGADRVVIGTAAVENPELAEALTSQIRQSTGCRGPGRQGRKGIHTRLDRKHRRGRSSPWLTRWRNWASSACSTPTYHGTEP